MPHAPPALRANLNPQPDPHHDATPLFTRRFYAPSSDIVNVVPELIVKATSPFWWHLASYRTKILIVGLCFGVNMVLVHAGLGLSVPLQLLGVALNDFGSGLGEASVLGLSQFYGRDLSRTLLTAWSSGTGMAGVVGYLISMYALPHLDVGGRLGLGSFILACFWASFFLLLDRPWVDELRSAGRRGGGGVGGGANSCQEAVSPAEPAPPPQTTASTTAVNATPLLLSVDQPAASAAEWAGGSAPSAEEGGGKHLDSAAAMSVRAKLALQCSLLKYVLPLVLVYWAEYAAQAGAWTAFALPPSALADKAARVRAYQQLNLTYQVGVFFSRSAGKLFRLRVPWLWAVAWLQVALLVAFIADGATQMWTGSVLILPAFAVGLCGGTVYVQTQVAIDLDVPPEQREVALATACAGSPAGILLADVTSLFIQWCLFAYLGIATEGAAGECPFAVNTSATYT